MLPNHCGYDNKNDESILTILVDDFNGIVDTLWEGDILMIYVRSNVEERSKDTLLKSKNIAILWIENVEKDKDKHYFIEPMIVEIYKKILAYTPVIHTSYYFQIVLRI